MSIHKFYLYFYLLSFFASFKRSATPYAFIAFFRKMLQRYGFLRKGLWWFSPLLTSTCNYLPDLLGREVKMIADGFVGVHKGHAFFDR